MQSPRPTPWWMVALALLAMASSGCSRPGTYKRVSLTPAIRATSPPATQAAVLRVAVGAILSPQSTIHGYDQLVAYLGERLGRPTELIQRNTYAETNELVRTRQVDLAFVCTGAYVRGAQDFGMRLLAAPEIDGQFTYRSYIIVPSASQSQRLEDLRGRVFAFTDPMSLSGYLAPLYQLASGGETPDLYFGRTLFTYSHDKSMRAVAEGWVDGAAVDSLVYEGEMRANPAYAQRTRVIWRSEPFGVPPVVVPPGLNPELAAQLRAVLLHMHEDAQGRRALSTLGIDRFAEVDAQIYDSARQVVSATGGLMK